ncbi:ribbon-helix-helix protein, CopG family [Leucobacter sp. Z1108]|uniref:ribbon-helix-helix protein, CopG family n=1 Tax=Leucobacter sp. Z1108 TaxID=3439066 RepID=UPI003F393763
MAMTVRLPEDLDTKLELLARTRHISKHAILIEAAERLIAEEAKTAAVLSAVDTIGAEYADAIRRLADA